ncbi:hypothetical protein FOA52_009319 [Chlamydomonas sp. UWO 241]|nr:hypothetical protein FOA52_009319 [Chlamydomonas sp. UWO 241]
MGSVATDAPATGGLLEAGTCQTWLVDLDASACGGGNTSSYLVIELWALNVDGSLVPPTATVEGIGLMAQQGAAPMASADDNGVTFYYGQRADDWVGPLSGSGNSAASPGPIYADFQGADDWRPYQRVVVPLAGGGGADFFLTVANLARHLDDAARAALAYPDNRARPHNWVEEALLAVVDTSALDGYQLSVSCAAGGAAEVACPTPVPGEGPCGSLAGRGACDMTESLPTATPTSQPPPNRCLCAPGFAGAGCEAPITALWDGGSTALPSPVPGGWSVLYIPPVKATGNGSRYGPQGEQFDLEISVPRGTGKLAALLTVIVPAVTATGAPVTPPPTRGDGATVDGAPSTLAGVSLPRLSELDLGELYGRSPIQDLSYAYAILSRGFVYRGPHSRAVKPAAASDAGWFVAIYNAAPRNRRVASGRDPVASGVTRALPMTVSFSRSKATSDYATGVYVCPRDCNSHGACVRGPLEAGFACMCRPPWTGPLCGAEDRSGGTRALSVQRRFGSPFVKIQPGERHIYEVSLSWWDLMRSRGSLNITLSTNPASGARVDMLVTQFSSPERNTGVIFYEAGGGLQTVAGPGVVVIDNLPTTRWTIPSFNEIKWRVLIYNDDSVTAALGDYQVKFWIESNSSPWRPSGWQLALLISVCGIVAVVFVLFWTSWRTHTWRWINSARAAAGLAPVLPRETAHDRRRRERAERRAKSTRGVPPGIMETFPVFKFEDGMAMTRESVASMLDARAPGGGAAAAAAAAAETKNKKIDDKKERGAAETGMGDKYVVAAEGSSSAEAGTASSAVVKMTGAAVAAAAAPALDAGGAASGGSSTPSSSDGPRADADASTLDPRGAVSGGPSSSDGPRAAPAALPAGSAVPRPSPSDDDNGPRAAPAALPAGSAAAGPCPSPSDDDDDDGPSVAIDLSPALGADGDADAQCAVCLCDFEHGAVMRQLPCTHYFHQACVDGWLSKHTTCPICRLLLVPEADAGPAAATTATDGDGTGEGLGGSASTSRGAPSAPSGAALAPAAVPAPGGGARPDGGFVTPMQAARSLVFRLQV